MKKDSRFVFQNKTSSLAEIFIYGPIGDDYFDGGISARSFKDELTALGKVRSIDLHIDSPGGSVSDARTMYTLLTEHSAKINVRIDAFAISAASFLAMAGDNIAIAEGGAIMIHESSVFSFGNKRDLRKTAGMLEMQDKLIAETYAARTGMTTSKLLRMMEEETWVTWIEAVD